MKLSKKIMKDRYDVVATSNGITRTERINTSNPIFKGAKTKTEIKHRYEGYWNINKYEPKVTVLKVKKVGKKRKAQSMEDYVGF